MASYRDRNLVYNLSGITFLHSTSFRAHNNDLPRIAPARFLNFAASIGTKSPHNQSSVTVTFAIISYLHAPPTDNVAATA